MHRARPPAVVRTRHIVALLLGLAMSAPAATVARAAPPGPHDLGIRAVDAPSEDLVLDERVALSPRLAIGAYGWSTRLDTPELGLSHTLATAALHFEVAPRLDLQLGAGVAAARYARSETLDLDGPVYDTTGERVRVRQDLQPAMVAGLRARLGSSTTRDIDALAVLGGSLGPDDDPIYSALFALRLTLK